MSPRWANTRAKVHKTSDRKGRFTKKLEIHLSWSSLAKILTFLSHPILTALEDNIQDRTTYLESLKYYEPDEVPYMQPSHHRRNATSLGLLLNL